MNAVLKYEVIESKEQYLEYCNRLEELDFSDDNSEETRKEKKMLLLLIETWDNEQNSFEDSNPVEIIKYLMEENNLKSKDLSEILSISKGVVSEILNYKKGLSKQSIRRLSGYFKLKQEVFNRPYNLA